MKIALVYDMLYPFSIGGVETRNLELGKELVLRGHEVHLFGAKLWKGDDDIKISKGLYCHGVSGYGKKHRNRFRGNRKPHETVLYSICLFKNMMKYGFDIIDATAFPYIPTFSANLYSLIKKKPIVLTWHEIWGDYWKGHGISGRFGNMLEKHTAKKSKNNICVSGLTEKRFRSMSKQDARLFENWIDLQAINRIGPSKEKYDLISVGRHMKHKNFDMLLKIVKMLSSDYPTIKALIIGEGPETLKLLRLKEKLSVKNLDILSFTKDRELIYSYMKSSRIFVLLSDIEGFSITSFEAMACGLPVITIDSKDNALKEYVLESGAGKVCRKNDAIIASEIARLLNDKAGYDKMSKKALSYSKRFDLKKKIPEIEKYYKSIIKEFQKRR